MANLLDNMWLWGRQAQRANPVKGGVGLTGAGTYLGPAAAAADLIYSIPRAAEAGVGLYEAGEALVRGGLGSKAGIKATNQRINDPGYQPFTALKAAATQLPPDAGGRAYGTQATLNGKPVVWAGKDYGWQSPKTGSATMDALNAPGTQSRFIQDAVTGSPADRAYAAEKERARQLTEQDPLFKKYQVAELSKQYNAAKGDEREKIGMQIWAQTNPQLAAKMKPGQTGYSDVSTAFQNLSPITGIIGKMPASSFAMPAASAMPGMEMNYGASAPQVAIAGFNPATVASAVAPGVFNEKLPANLTDYLTKPVEANAKFANIDETTQGLLRQAYNQRIK